MLKSWFPFLQKDPKEIVRKWRREIRRQKLEIDRDIRNLTVEQKKAERSIKEAVGRTDMASAKVGVFMRFWWICIRIHAV